MQKPMVSNPRLVLSKIEAWLADKPDSVCEVAPLLSHYDRAMELILEFQTALMEESE